MGLALAVRWPPPADVPLSADRRRCPIRDALISDRVAGPVKRIGACRSAPPDLPFEFHVVDTPDINAFACRAGSHVFRGAAGRSERRRPVHPDRDRPRGTARPAPVRRTRSSAWSPPRPGVPAPSGVTCWRGFLPRRRAPVDREGLNYTAGRLDVDGGVLAMETLLRLGEGATRSFFQPPAHPEPERGTGGAGE